MKGGERNEQILQIPFTSMVQILVISHRNSALTDYDLPAAPHHISTYNDRRFFNRHYYRPLPCLSLEMDLAGNVHDLSRRDTFSICIHLL